LSNLDFPFLQNPDNTGRKFQSHENKEVVEKVAGFQSGTHWKLALYFQSSNFSGGY
jgi:hypothetical protein